MYICREGFTFGVAPQAMAAITDRATPEVKQLPRRSKISMLPNRSPRKPKIAPVQVGGGKMRFTVVDQTARVDDIRERTDNETRVPRKAEITAT